MHRQRLSKWRLVCDGRNWWNILHMYGKYYLFTCSYRMLFCVIEKYNASMHSLISVSSIYPFPSYKRFLTPLQQTTFWKHSNKKRHKQFFLLPQCFTLLVIGYPFNYRDFSIFWQNMFKVICCRIAVRGTGLRHNCTFFSPLHNHGHI